MTRRIKGQGDSITLVVVERMHSRRVDCAHWRSHTRVLIADAQNTSLVPLVEGVCNRSSVGQPFKTPARQSVAGLLKVVDICGHVGFTVGASNVVDLVGKLCSRITIHHPGVEDAITFAERVRRNIRLEIVLEYSELSDGAIESRYQNSSRGAPREHIQSRNQDDKDKYRRGDGRPHPGPIEPRRSLVSGFRRLAW